MNTSKSIKIAIFSLSAALVILIYAALSKSIEISQLNREVAELQEKLVSSQETEKEVRVVAAFFKGATNGISDTEPKAIETASKVVSYVIQLKILLRSSFGTAGRGKRVSIVGEVWGRSVY